MDDLPILKVGTDSSKLTIISEPFVKLSFRGYMPCVKVIVEKSKLEKILVIAAKSLAESLESMRSENEGNFTGLKFELSKADDSKLSPYVVKKI